MEIECTFDDSAWRGHLYCRLRKASHPECGDPDANGALVVFDSSARRGDIAGAAAFEHVRRSRIVAVDLGPSCD